MSRVIGLLHPGEMGAAVAAALRTSGHEVAWVSDGRSSATRDRATDAGLTDAGTVTELTSRCDVVVSICPPHAALDVAREVAETGFRGVFVDANAVAPTTARKLADTVTPAGAAYVDGGIIGSPPRRSGTTRLYLSGAAADTVAALFAGTPVDAVVLDERPDAASALKMTYAAWTKGTAALLLAIRGVARQEGVDDWLLEEWARSQSELAKRSNQAEASAASKGWRWVGEMEEIAATFGAAGWPAGFHQACAEIYRRT